MNEVAQFSAAAAEVSTQVVQVADRLAQLTQCKIFKYRRRICYDDEYYFSGS